MCGELERAILLAIYLGVGLVALSMIVGGLFVWRVWLPAWKTIRRQHVETFEAARDRIHRDTDEWIDDRQDSIRRSARRARRVFKP